MRVYYAKKASLPTNNIRKILGDTTRNPNDANRIERLRLIADASHGHSWTWATADAVARSVVGSGWKFVEDNRYSDATKKNYKKIVDFFDYSTRDWKNIKDFITLPAKIQHTVRAFTLFANCGWEIIYRDGEPVGFDVLPGILSPNIKPNGDFDTPNFFFYPWNRALTDPQGFHRDEIVYFVEPGTTGNIMGETPYETLIHTSLPSDLYAALSYREMFKNVNAPYNGVWQVADTVSDDDFELFLQLLEQRYSGPENYGRNPLVVRGGVEFKEVRARSREDAPYLEGRTFNREEFSAATGVDSHKMGIVDTANKSNLRETRREFHENRLRPLFEILEDTINNQVIARVLGIRGWKIRFNHPDITNRLEQASIDMRMLQWGVYSPNEVRAQKGDGPREGGDIYYIPLNMAKGGGNGGEEDEPSTGTEPIPPSRPPRDEENPDSMKVLSRKSALLELKKWRSIYLKTIDGKRQGKEFVASHIHNTHVQMLNESLSKFGADFEKIKTVFDEIRKIINESECYA